MTTTDKLLIAVLLMLSVEIIMQVDARRRRSREPMTPDGKYDAGPAMVGNITAVTWIVIIALSIGIVVGIVAKSIHPELPDYTPMILPALTMIAGQIMGERKQIIAYLYDGTPSQNETNATNARIVAHRSMQTPTGAPPDATATATGADGTTVTATTGATA